MPRFVVSGILLFLLLGAGYGILQAARAIPWNCDDWQAFAHADRATSILESLAENRGKTLYCGIDQSDTFTKAETWAAGKDRNERDDTVYWGERGSFRGFIAAQEGWLTDGESGITGQSIATIFEFPRQERKRRRKEPKPTVRYGRSYPDSTLANPGLTSNPNGVTTGYLVSNPRSGEQNQPTYIPGPRLISNGFVRAIGTPGSQDSDENTARASARLAYSPPTDAQAAGWALGGTTANRWATLEVQGGATAECEALGYTRAAKVKWWYLDEDGDGVPDLQFIPNIVSPPNYRFALYRTILYTAFCYR